MRTTVTLDPDVAALVKRVMAERQTSFKQAINDAIRAGLSGKSKPFSTPTFRMGSPSIPLTHAVRLAAEMEDEEIRRKIAVRK